MPTLTSTAYDDIRIGDRAEHRHRFTQRELLLFAAASGDCNPVHLDPEFAATTPFGEPVAHGIWSAAVISAAIGMVFPGPGSVYLGQTLEFLRPVKLGDDIHVQLEVTEKRDRRREVVLSCVVSGPSGKPVVRGEARVMAPAESISVPAPRLPEIRLAG
ncbi:MAG: MaoC family dehydratase [Pseudomonadota bacterium]|nr:MaoC family dehydratase [Pseudomonadota bacterium]